MKKLLMILVGLLLICGRAGAEEKKIYIIHSRPSYLQKLYGISGIFKEKSSSHRTFLENIAMVNDDTVYYRVAGLRDGRIDGDTVYDLWEFEKFYNFSEGVKTIHFLVTASSGSAGLALSCYDIIRKLSETYIIIAEIMGEVPILKSHLIQGWEDGANINVWNR